MIDRIANFFRGTQEERDAQNGLDQLAKKSTLTPRDRESQRRYRGVTRRVMIRRTGAAVGTAATGGLALWIWSEANRDTTDEATYNFYLNSFESVAGEDQEANELLTFFKERRKRGKFVGQAVVADEPGDPEYNFYTAIADPRINPQAFNNLYGFAQFNYENKPPFLMLKKVPITSVMVGVVLAHEALHVKQRLTGYEQSRADGFIAGEQEAYELEFRLLDQFTKGKFKEVLKEQVKGAPVGSYKTRITSEDASKINPLFPASLGREEDGVRIPAFVLGMNFALLENKGTTAQEIIQLKRDYIKLLFNGRIGIEA